MKAQQVLALAVMVTVSGWGTWNPKATAAPKPAAKNPPAQNPPPQNPPPQNPTPPTADVEPVDGAGNNFAHPAWGAAGTDILRISPAAYADGINAPSLTANLSARTISNLLNNQADPDKPSADISTVDTNACSDYGYAFGQFLDHDMDLTPDGGARFDIAVDATDSIGPNALPFTRSLTDPSIGGTSPAQQVNVVTSYLDLSQVYGSTQTIADAMRTFSAGLLKTSPGNMLPYNNSTYFTADQIAALNMANDAGAVSADKLFATGDRRGNENLELTALETLFVRNHNSIAHLLASNHADWTDEQLYQEARKLNIAQYQAIVYNEWIPAVLGPQSLQPYRGYNPAVNASIANEFSTVAFRFGHSMVSPDIAREGDNGLDVGDDIPLEFDFFDPNLLNPNGVVDPLTGLTSTDIGPVLKASADGNGQAMDPLAISAIRNMLFGNGGFGGDDLMARDVQRARDNGIADYNTVRHAYGLPSVPNFGALTTFLPIEAWQQAYPGGVGTIDVFEGGLAEPHVPGSDVGPTFQAIMVDQFRRLRDGDRFFYMNEPFSAEETSIFQHGNSLAKVIMANTNVTNLQPDVMVFRASIAGTITVKGGSKNAAAGITVDLLDMSGEVLAETKTNLQGQYAFNQNSGPADDLEVTPGVAGTGQYAVAVELPSGMTQTSAASGPILIDRGDRQVTGINFNLTAAKPAALAPTTTGGKTGKTPKPVKKKKHA